MYREYFLTSVFGTAVWWVGCVNLTANISAIDYQIGTGMVLNSKLKSLLYLFSRNKKYYVGLNAMNKLGILLCKRPIERGIIKDFKYIEKLFNYIDLFNI